MINYFNCRGKLIRMTEPYPIYSRENDDEIIGYTKVGDMAVVTYSDAKDDYHEVAIISGEYTGVDTLALNNRSINYPYPEDFRQDWCPLKSAPEEQLVWHDDDDWVMGYNNCVREIMGE